MAIQTLRGRPTKQPSLIDLLFQRTLELQAQEQQSRKDALVGYADDPVRFVQDCIAFPEGQSLTAYQRDILSQLPKAQRLVVRSPRGAGKTCLDALAVIWFSLTSEALQQDWKVATVAGVGRQLKEYLWPEIDKWSRRLRWDRIGRRPFSSQTELLSASLRLEYGQAFAVSTNNPGLIEGLHAERVFVLIDEAKVVPDGVFDAMEGALSTGGAQVAYALVTSTPGLRMGRFWEMHGRRTQYADWSLRPITSDEVLTAGRMSTKHMQDRKRQWGEEHVLYRAQMLGQFSDESDDGVIPVAWIEAAQSRWQQWADAGKPTDERAPVVLGVDVAREGEDRTAIAVRRGDTVEEARTYPRGETMQTTGYVVQQLQHHPGALAVVDVIGVGAGVVDRLREQGYPVEAFGAAERAPGPDRSGELQFLNRRSWAWWRTRELLDPNPPAGEEVAQIALPPDEQLLEDLAAPRWKPTSSGRIQIEDKPSIKKRLGRSPDLGDAVVMALAGDESVEVNFW